MTDTDKEMAVAYTKLKFIESIMHKVEIQVDKPHMDDKLIKSKAYDEIKNIVRTSC
jgi:cobalamin biosynthesis Co2+ chelatase CbiK